MLNKYYFPRSVQEIFRLLLGTHDYSEFWRLKSLVSEAICNTVSDTTGCKTNVFETKRREMDSRLNESIKGLRFRTPQDIMEKRHDNIYEDIVRNVIYKRKQLFYLDICLSVYYSVVYYMEKDKFLPFIDLIEHKEDKSELLSGWYKFLRKGEDRKRRSKKKNKTTEDKNNYDKLSDFGVELPLNTKIRYYQKELFLSSFGADIIRFFIRARDKETDGRRSSDILDLFSEERRNEIKNGLRCDNPVYELIRRVHPDFEDMADTIVIIDEIQESVAICNRIREFTRQLKSDFIITGSYLGRILNREFKYSAGDLDSLEIHTLDFREFLMALEKEELYQELDLYGNRRLPQWEEERSTSS